MEDVGAAAATAGPSPGFLGPSARPPGTPEVVEGSDVAPPAAVKERAHGAVQLQLKALVRLVVELQGEWRDARVEQVLQFAGYSYSRVE